ncbi:uncharacterized protein METZ01_LOCUS454623 [marine metagenome]|uniref:Uncharacterized protein n=1 Tax=marine metagenome TaxID=408172 RepID=A0A383A2G7_9ZZZZ
MRTVNRDMTILELKVEENEQVPGENLMHQVTIYPHNSVTVE